PHRNAPQRDRRLSARRAPADEALPGDGRQDLRPGVPAVRAGGGRRRRRVDASVRNAALQATGLWLTTLPVVITKSRQPPLVWRTRCFKRPARSHRWFTTLWDWPPALLEAAA